MDADRGRLLAPLAAAVAAAATVVIVVFLAESGGSSGPKPPGPVRPVPQVVDRGSVSADASAWAAFQLRRCLAQVGADAAYRDWGPAQVLAYRRDDRLASLVVAVGRSTVGGCSVAPGEVTPLRPWGPAVVGEGARPFVWLTALPDLTTDVVAGPVRPEVVRMEITSGDGRQWRVGVAAGTFAGRVPPGSPSDPRTLTVSAYDAGDSLLYTGPAVG